MTPFYLSEFSPNPLGEGDQDQRNFQTLRVPRNDHTSSAFYPVLFNTSQVQGANDRDHHHHQVQQQELDDHLLIHGSIGCPVSFPTDHNDNNNTIGRSMSSTNQLHQEEDRHQPGKWMSSKMRFMRKMMTPDGVVMNKPRRTTQLPQDQSHQPTQESSSGGIVRVCSDCNTTKTPLWRSGPSGPKSLCNACGIRQRKARRAMAAVSSGELVPAVARSKVRKEKRLDVDHTVPFKKRCRFGATGAAQKKKICFEDIVISLSKSSDFHRVFPQDEKDAAILLMALSCGLICS